jgi:hypothetical protein
VEVPGVPGATVTSVADMENVVGMLIAYVADPIWLAVYPVATATAWMVVVAITD